MREKKILVINTKYREYGGEDSNIVDEIKLLKKYFHVEYLEYNNKQKLKISDILAFITSNNKNSNKILEEKLKIFNPDIVYVNNTWFKANLGIFNVLQSHNLKTILKIHNFRYDCTRNFFSKRHFQNSLFCKKCGSKPSRYQVVNKYFPDSYLKSFAVLRYGNKYFKILKNHPMTICTLNNFHKEFLIKLGVDKDKVKILYNPINKQINRNNEVNKKNNEVIFAGRVSSEKGIEELLETWMRSNTKNMKLKIIGEGELLEKPKGKFANNNIIFTGFLEHDKTLEIIKNARAVITATKIFEGQPRLLCEASSYGVPSIFPNFGGVGEYFPENYSFSFEQYDYEQLREIIEILDDDELVHEEGMKAFKYINSLITENDTVNTFNNLIK